MIRRTVLKLSLLQVLVQVLIPTRRDVVCEWRALASLELERGHCSEAEAQHCATILRVPIAGLMLLRRMRCSCWQRSTQRWLQSLLLMGSARLVCLCPLNIVVPRPGCGIVLVSAEVPYSTGWRRLHRHSRR